MLINWNFAARALHLMARVILLATIACLVESVCKIDPDDSGHVDINNSTLPTQDGKIVEEAFMGCLELTSVNISEGFISIGDRAFSHTRLGSVVIPASVRSIGNESFKSAGSLRDVSFAGDSKLMSIGAYSFEDTHLSNFSMPNSVEYLGKGAFYNCKFLKNVTLSSLLHGIEEKTFARAATLYSIVIPPNVTFIDNKAFFACWGLHTIDTSNNFVLEKIGNEAFCECIAITTMRIPDSVRAIGDQAFGYTGKLISVTLPDRANMSLGERIFSPGCSLRSLVIPHSWTEVPQQFCGQCYHLKKVTLGRNIRKIGYGAFYSCFFLHGTLEIADTVEIISGGAFALTDYTHVVLGKGLTLLDSLAFGGTQTTTVTINSQNIDIKLDAFSKCVFLRDYGIKFARNIFVTDPSKFKVELWDREVTESNPLSGEKTQLLVCDDKSKTCGCAPGLGSNDLENDDDDEYFQCTFCPAGRTSDGGSQTPCRLCHAGKYRDSSSIDGSCTDCAQGKYSSGPGADRESSCMKCPSGRYSSAFGSTECSICPAGTMCSGESRRNYTDCQPGTYQIHKGRPECTPCERGSFNPDYGMPRCQLCPAGKFGNTTGSDVMHCLDCAPGRYASANGSASCEKCNKGYYQGESGATSCLGCSEDTLSNEDFTGCVADLSHSLTAMLFDNHLPWYIASGTSAAFMTVAGYVTFMREKVPKELANHSRFTAALNSLLCGFGFGSEISVMIVMWESASSATFGLGTTILLFRLLHFVCGMILTLALFGPEKSVKAGPVVAGMSRHRKDLNMKWATENWSLCEMVAFLALCDVSMFTFLPWKRSRFNELSEGYPNLIMMKICMSVKTVQTTVAVICEIAFLGIQKPSNGSENALLILNVIVGMATVILETMVLYLRKAILSGEVEEEEEEEEREVEGNVKEKEERTENDDNETSYRGNEGDVEGGEIVTPSVDEIEFQDLYGGGEGSSRKVEASSKLDTNNIRHTDNPLHGSAMMMKSSASLSARTPWSKGVASKKDKKNSEAMIGDVAL